MLALPVTPIIDPRRRPPEADNGNVLPRQRRRRAPNMMRYRLPNLDGHIGFESKGGRTRDTLAGELFKSRDGRYGWIPVVPPAARLGPRRQSDILDSMFETVNDGFHPRHCHAVGCWLGCCTAATRICVS